MDNLEEEELEENVEKQQDAVKEYYEDEGEDSSPTYTQKDDLYSLFWKVIKIEDSSKVGNLDKVELGMLNMSVRDMQSIAVFCDLVEYEQVAKWLRTRAQIILRTSSSKKGWLPELFVSAKKYSSKEKRLGMPEGTLEPAKPKTFWNKLKGK